MVSHTLLLLLSSLLGVDAGMSGCYGGGQCPLQGKMHGCCDCHIPKMTCDAEGASWMDGESSSCEGICATGTEPCTDCTTPPPPPNPPPFPKPPPPATCNHPDEYGGVDGYYVEGVHGVYDDTHASHGVYHGKRADDSTWKVGETYPMGQLVVSTSPYASETCKTVGCPTYRDAATCAALRFTAKAPATVYKMKDLSAFEACDFTGATLLKTFGATDEAYDYQVAADTPLGTVLYMASQDGCAEGLKVATEVSGDYHALRAQCEGMGKGSSRIVGCDCEGAIRSHSTIDPCFTGFVSGCLADMPDDTSCCPADMASTTYVSAGYSGSYSAGTCVAKSKTPSPPAPPPAPPAPPPAPPPSSDGLSTGVIVGIAVGGGVGVILLGLGIFLGKGMKASAGGGGKAAPESAA